MSVSNETKFVVTAQTDGATQKLNETADATERMVTAAQAAGEAQVSMAKQVDAATKAATAHKEALTRSTQAQQTHLMTVKAFGEGSREAAESAKRLAVANEALAKAADHAKDELDQAKLAVAKTGAEADKVSPALAKASKEIDKLGKQSEQTAHSQKQLELSMKGNENAAKKSGGGFDLLGMAGGKLMSVLGPAALGATLVGVASWLGEASEKTLQYETALLNLPFALDGAKAATHGLMSESALAVSASQALALGVVKTEAEFNQLASDAAKIALKLGTSTEEMLGDLTTALGRGSAMILDNAGIILKVSDANEAYAKSIGTTADKLDEAQKKIAFQTAAMEAIRKSADATTVAYDSNAAAVARLKVNIGDLWGSIERGTVNAVGSIVSEIEGSVTAAMTLQSAVEQTAAAVDTSWSPAFTAGAAATANWAADLLITQDAVEQMQRIITDPSNLAAFEAANAKEREKRDLLSEEADFAERQRKALEAVAKSNESFLDAQAAASVVYGPEEAPKKKKGGKGKKKEDKDLALVKAYNPNDAGPDLMADWAKEDADQQAKILASQVATREATIENISMEIEAREAAGLQAEDLYARRMAAEQGLTDFIRQNSRDQKQIDEARTRAEKAQHDKRVRNAAAAFKAQQEEEAAREARMQVLGGHVEALAGSISAAAQDEANSTGAAVALGLEAWLKGMRNKMIVQAVVETALGLASAASYNFPGAAAHFAAAGAAGAAAVATGVAGAALGAGIDAAGARPPAKGSGSSASHTGGDAGGSSGSSATGGTPGREGNEYQQVPVSYEQTRRGRDAPLTAPAAQAPATHVTVQVTGIVKGSAAQLGQEVSKWIRAGERGGKRR